MNDLNPDFSRYFTRFSPFVSQSQRKYTFYDHSHETVITVIKTLESSGPHFEHFT